MSAIQHNVALKSLNTFAVDAVAENYARVGHLDELAELLSQHTGKNLTVLGGGSNILLTQKVVSDLVVHIDLKGIDVIDESRDAVIVKVAGGEVWHQLVCWSLDREYGGLENLSLIPGSVGAAPVQNIGAYGVELKDVLVEVEAMNVSDQQIKVFSRDTCQFAYRDSIFKSAQRGQWVITSVSLRLSKRNHRLNLDYGAINATLAEQGITSPSIKDVGDAVTRIRQQRLPNPDELPNAGSFFKNPVIEASHYQRLLSKYPEMPGYVLDDDSIKVPAGWLIEQCGWKGRQQDRCAVHTEHALVLVNNGGASGAEILALAKEIQESVKRQFQLLLGIEINILGSA